MGVVKSTSSQLKEIRSERRSLNTDYRLRMTYVDVGAHLRSYGLRCSCRPNDAERIVNTFRDGSRRTNTLNR